MRYRVQAKATVTYDFEVEGDSLEDAREQASSEIFHSYVHVDDTIIIDLDLREIEEADDV